MAVPEAQVHRSPVFETCCLRVVFVYMVRHANRAGCGGAVGFGHACLSMLQYVYVAASELHTLQFLMC